MVISCVGITVRLRVVSIDRYGCWFCMYMCTVIHLCAYIRNGAYRIGRYIVLLMLYVDMHGYAFCTYIRTIVYCVC